VVRSPARMQYPGKRLAARSGAVPPQTFRSILVFEIHDVSVAGVRRLRARHDLRQSQNRRCRRDHHRKHQDPRDCPRPQPMPEKSSSPDEIEARYGGSDRTGQSRLQSRKEKMRITARWSRHALQSFLKLAENYRNKICDRQLDHMNTLTVTQD
jgi:hypothetical protein